MRFLSQFKTKGEPTRDQKEDKYQDNYRGIAKTCRNAVRKAKAPLENWPEMSETVRKGSLGTQGM